ncbi:NUDIX domain-containing protein [Jannaschia pohangensis]|uniref:Bifunctional NMN adenylyltransferase/nudix hydrolase n=1 Tax=Jannaschia pohangensis TaxID=390807 RepID=A0A1I3JLQ6_9RHOB|nr:NUDIX domain-containing protein [Jannaschia pohangensis]SFI61191.1 bifunctional NMN adenylyltransferase/nudix hydrolase [Jannaschia pohangensis]
MAQAKPRTLSVYIGRFQPFHDGHLFVLKSALAVSDATLILVGSAYRPRSYKNPFTYAERRSFIRAALPRGGVDAARVHISPLVDTLYNDRAWASNVRIAVNTQLAQLGWDRQTTEVRLIGFEKDMSSAYLRWFPEWQTDAAEPYLVRGEVLNATALRDEIFFGEGLESSACTGEAIATWLAANPEAADLVRHEGEYVRAYRAKVAAAERVLGYPIPANAADAVVVKSGHVLLVERRNAPGRGLMALPGGHIGPDETSRQAVVRELYEETHLSVPRPVIAASIRASRVFDHPDRSERGWVRTEAFLIELDAKPGQLDRIKGGDDAARAIWMPIAEITPETMFEDHFDILQDLIPDIPFAYRSVLMAQS